MWSLPDASLSSWLKKCLPKFLYRFFVGGEWLRFRRRGSVADAKKAIWSRLSNPPDSEAWMSGIIWADSVHLCWQRRHSHNDLKPFFHGHLSIKSDYVILEGRISASRSSQFVTIVFLIALLSLAVFFAWTIFVPLCCCGMALLILGAVKFSRRKSNEDERRIISEVQAVFPEQLTESRTRGS